MGDSATASRPRKSTMSRLGRVFGLSSTNLAHDAHLEEQKQQQQHAPRVSPQASTTNFFVSSPEEKDHVSSSDEALSSSSSSLLKQAANNHSAVSIKDVANPQPHRPHVNDPHSPLLRSSPHSPTTNATTTTSPPLTAVALQHAHAQQAAPAPPIQAPAPSRQSSLRVPPSAAAATAASSSSAGTGISSNDVKKSGRASPAHSTLDHDLRSATAVSLSRSSSTTGTHSRASHNGTTASSTQRFVMLENGMHEHHLKNAKRQEKLGHMIKDLLGAKKLRSEAVSAVPNILSSVIPPISENPSTAADSTTLASSNSPVPVPQQQQQQKDAPPTLFAGLINQVKRGEITQYSGAAPANQSVISATSTIKVDSRSFVEKYGTCQEVIGRGAFGVVRVSHKKDETGEVLYAVKEFKRRPQESDKKYSRRLTSEFCISSSLQHGNIIHTLDLLQDAKGDYCEVMEFCSGGDLYSLIITSGKLEYVEADCFFKQLMRGVNYMHEMGVAHRDLKPENLLLTANGTLKITDFGNGELFRTAWETDVHMSGGICGSSPYIAPEEYTASEFDPRKVDIWSCGVIYMAMRTGRQLWKLANAEDEFYSTYLAKRKDAKGYEPIENLKRARCRNVIYSILDPVPSRRITSKQILNSEWCREIKLCHAGEAK